MMRPGVYKWLVVGMLWLVCLLNYADRMAIRSVFTPIKTEMGLSDLQLGLIGSSFMWVYALASPLAGIIGDRVRRKTLIVGGLAVWSLVTVATGFATSYWQLLALCALEGLGEAFYFPASMSLVSDYHGRDTRSRAMAIHQSSVYMGTTFGGTLAGVFSDWLGWRSGFYFFGVLGVLLAGVLAFTLREPRRGLSESDADLGGHGELRIEQQAGLLRDSRARVALLFLMLFIVAYLALNLFLAWTPPSVGQTSYLSQKLAGLSGAIWLQVIAVVGLLCCAGVLADRLFQKRFTVALMVIFVGGNLVANVFLTWLPSFCERQFNLTVSQAGLHGTLWLQVASVVGVLCAGVLADRLVRRYPAGRMITQTLGLFLGIPFIVWLGGVQSLPLAIVAMLGFGIFKGIYDANIWASLYDVVKPEQRATAVGFLNCVGWFGGSIGPPMVGALSATVGLGYCLSATSMIYLLIGLLYVWGILKYMPRSYARVPVKVAVTTER